MAECPRLAAHDSPRHCDQAWQVTSRESSACGQRSSGAHRSSVAKASLSPRFAAVATLVGALACAAAPEGRTTHAAEDSAPDTMGVAPTSVLRIVAEARPELVEASGATLSASQSGVVFTINDSGNQPVLFALDTTGADRGAWRVTGARNVDWEAASAGPCGQRAPAGSVDTTRPAAGAPNACVYIGDVGDNDAKRASRVIYKVPEPAAQRAGFVGTVAAEALAYRYADQPHDVEAMYVAPNGDTFLITKRRLVGPDRRLRPSLVFHLPAAAWGGASQPVVAALVDSLPIVPGSA